MMTEELDQQPDWDAFEPVGGSADSPRPPTPLHTWLLLLVFTTAVGAALGMILMLWFRTAGTTVTQNMLRSAFFPGPTEPLVYKLALSGALRGGVLGLLLGLVIWARSLLGRDG